MTPQEIEPSPVGKRLAAIRARKGWTAAELARRVPDESVTRMVITNVERGRKRDLTVTELVQISSALDVSPLALIVDPYDPWGAIPFDGVTDDVAQLTALEYGRRANIYGHHSTSWYAFPMDHAWFLDALIESEIGVKRLACLTDMLRGGEEFDYHSVYGGKTEYGDTWMLDGSQVTEDEYADTASGIVSSYRYALYRMADSIRGRRPLAPLPPSISSRLDAVRESVAAIIQEFPDVDYGQDDHRDPWGVMRRPVLDPKTARPLRVSNSGVDEPPNRSRELTDRESAEDGSAADTD